MTRGDEGLEVQRAVSWERSGPGDEARAERCETAGFPSPDPTASVIPQLLPLGSTALIFAPMCRAGSAASDTGKTGTRPALPAYSDIRIN